MIPPRVFLKGDKDKAETLRGFALSQLEVLHNAMSFRGLKQDVRRITSSNGIRIAINSNFGIDSISIFVPSVVGAEKERAIEEWIDRASLDVYGAAQGQAAGIPNVVAVTGHWELIGNYCGLSGAGTEIDNTYYDWIWCEARSQYLSTRVFTYELIVGNKRQIQKTVQLPRTELGDESICDVPPVSGCELIEGWRCECWPASDKCVTTHDNCIDPDHTFPCESKGPCYEPYPGWWEHAWWCHGVSILEYYEWEVEE